MSLLEQFEAEVVFVLTALAVFTLTAAVVFGTFACLSGVGREAQQYTHKDAFRHRVIDTELGVACYALRSDEGIACVKLEDE